MGSVEKFQEDQGPDNPTAGLKKADVVARFIALATLVLTCFNTYLTFHNRERDDERYIQGQLESAWDELAGSEAAPAIISNPALTSKQRQELDKVGRKIDSVLDDDPENPLALTLKGIYFAKCRMPIEAREQFDKALVADPKFARAKNAIGRLLADEGKCNEAIKEFQAAINLDPRLPPPYLGWASCLRQLGRSDDEAAVVLQKGIDSVPTFAPLYLDLGNIYEKQGRVDDALAQYRICRNVDDSLAACYKNAVVVLLRNDREKEAHELVNQAASKGITIRLDKTSNKQAGSAHGS